MGLVLVGALDRHDTSSHQRDNYLKALGTKLEKQTMWLDMIDTPGDVIIQSAVEVDRQAQGLPAGIGFWGFVEGMRSGPQPPWQHASRSASPAVMALHQPQQSPWHRRQPHHQRSIS
jgi:hypothetical protein